MTDTARDKETPDLLLTTARLLRDHLGSVGKGKVCEDLNAALLPHDEADAKKAAAAQAKLEAAQAKEADKIERKANA